MVDCGTLRAMTSAGKFATELQRRREIKRLSRRRLAQQAGLSESGILNIELRGAQPKRRTIIDIAVALNWDVDEALRLADEGKLSEGERALLSSSDQPLLSELAPYWEQLSERQRGLLLGTAQEFTRPTDPLPDITVHKWEVKPRKRPSRDRGEQRS